MDQVKLSPTKTKRATNEGTGVETLDAHKNFYHLKTSTYDRDKDNLTQMTVDAEKTSAKINTISDRRHSQISADQKSNAHPNVVGNITTNGAHMTIES